MTREIRFRGKRVDNGEWIYGYYLVDEQHNKPRHCIWTREFCGTGIANDLIEVDPDTVGQSTGLCDKNGREIWEGDKLAYDGMENQMSPDVVTWNVENARWQGVCYPKEGLGSRRSLSSEWCREKMIATDNI